MRQDLMEIDIAASEESERLLALDEALTKLAGQDPKVAELVKLRYFAGLTIKGAAEILGISPRTADHYWAYAKAWLREEIQDD
jgi:RNA polymerase sigma factor (sigma-70 family)